MIASEDNSSLYRELRAFQGFAELGLEDEALRVLGSLHALYPRHWQILESECAFHSQRKCWDELVRSTQELVSLRPDRACGWILWAYGARRAVSLAEAERILLRARELLPDEPVLYFNLACYAAVQGREGEAFGYLAEAIRRDAGCARMALEDDDLVSIQNQLQDRREVWNPTGLDEEALFLRDAEMGLKSREQVDGFVRNLDRDFLTRCLASVDKEISELAAAEFWRRWCTAEGELPRRLLDRATGLMVSCPEESRRLLVDLISRFPQWSEPVNKLATLEFLTERYQESLGLCEEVIRKEPAHFGAWSGAAMCALRLENWTMLERAASAWGKLVPSESSWRRLLELARKRKENTP